MHVLREILRQKLGLRRSHRQVATSLGVSAGKVAGVFADARALGLDAATVDAMSDAELDARLRPKTAPTSVRPEPDCVVLHLKLRRPGVTLALLHVEYLTAHPDGLRYTAFCDRYREWAKRHSPVMRQVHIAGDKLFVDYAGMKATFVDPQTGEIIEVELFVAVLGASNYTYAEATRTQQVADFVSSVSRAFSFIGGVTRAVVPDQLKSAVTIACRYDPLIQRTCAELGRHYATTIMPARPRSPRKAKVEVGVQIAERWLLARIRNETFTSLGALNARLAELTGDLNGRTMRTYKASRRELFERLDNGASASLPRMAMGAVLVLGELTFDNGASASLPRMGVSGERSNLRRMRRGLRARRDRHGSTNSRRRPETVNGQDLSNCQRPGRLRAPTGIDATHSRSQRTESDYNRASLGRMIHASQRRDRGVPSTLLRADVDEEHLVLVVMDDAAEARAQLDELAVIELASEHRELKVVAVALQGFEHPAQPVGAAHVVRHNVGLAHHRSSPRPERGVFANLAEQAPSEQPRLHLEDAPVADPVAEDGVRDQLVHPALVCMAALLDGAGRPFTCLGSRARWRGDPEELCLPCGLLA
jgi:transposase